MSGFFADAEQMRGQGRKFTRFSQGAGDTFAALHAGNHSFKRRGDTPVIQNPARNADRLHQRHASRDQRSHRTRETRRLGLAECVPEHRHTQAERVPPHRTAGSTRIGHEAENGGSQDESGGQSVRLQIAASGQQHERRRGNGHARIGKDLRKARYHEFQQDNNG